MNSSSPAAARRLRPVLALLAAFVLVSLAMESVLVVRSIGRAAVDGGTWTRCSIVLASSVVLLLLAVAAARGSRPAFRRARFISPIVVIAVVVVISIPGFLPDWVRLEQAACGLLVLPVAILLNLPGTVALFPGAQRGPGSTRVGA